MKKRQTITPNSQPMHELTEEQWQQVVGGQPTDPWMTPDPTAVE